MTGGEIRESFLRFFAERGHKIMPSASLIPASDPTLLFTNAGMVPFKDIFLGIEKPAHPRVADSQKCLRVSGKHNDLEDVGRDTYHHTFFEMLGNWSFGDYYKKEAIAWAWELLTGVWRLPKDKLWATVYTTDDEAEEWWRGETDISPSHILRFGEKDNFWEMGETGPCGPCSEIHIDRGKQACDKVNTPGHTCGVNADCARYIELWNLVFIQYNRGPDGSLAELLAKHVDTGMGLERIAAVLQGVRGNYDSDLLRALISRVEGMSGTPPAGKQYGDNPEQDISFRVIADHGRTISFLIADGVVPSNEGRGYVLRRILRRACRHGQLLGFESPFLFQVAEEVARLMGSAYPELVERLDYIAGSIRTEEERFADTLGKGLALLEQEISLLQQSGEKVLPGDVAFRLYDTYGFPLDLTEDFLSSEGLHVDQEGFDREMREQRARAREAQAGGRPKGTTHVGTSLPEVSSRFVGDRVYEWESQVLATLVNGEESKRAVREGEEVGIVTAETPFYGESGGQVGDQGVIETARGDLIEIANTQKPAPDLILHRGRVVRGAVCVGDRVRLRIDQRLREAARLNHSATHILHAALREFLGIQVRQAGSLVAPDRLRFDFTHMGPVREELIERIEEEVNAHVRENAQVTSEEMSFRESLRRGALAFFGEKYGDRVRVVQMGDFSLELCGGTHVARSGDIGFFKLRGESGVAAGVRRVEAVTGEGALEWVRQRERILREVGGILKGTEEEAVERLEKLLAQQRELEKRIAQAQSRLAGNQSEDISSKARKLDGVTVLSSRVEGMDEKGIREMADRLRERIGSGVIVLGTVWQEKVFLLAVVTKDMTRKYHAGEILKKIAPLVDGGGGGRPDFAQAGGKDPSGLDKALAKVYDLVGGSNPTTGA
jgi:alanyl-tRNA synthetase